MIIDQGRDQIDAIPICQNLNILSICRHPSLLNAASRLEIEVAVGSNQAHVLEEFSGGRTLTVNFDDPEIGTTQIIHYAKSYPLRAIIGIDDETTLIAAMASKALGVRGNDPVAVEVTRNKYQFRTRLANSGLAAPQFSLVEIDADANAAARQFSYPLVLKPLALSASRGVIRANNEIEFTAAFERVSAIVGNSTMDEDCSRHILIESYIPGDEVALEGVLVDGTLMVLAIFDKPDALEGPFFEETIYLTPSRHDRRIREAVCSAVGRAVGHLGLRQGAIHAELRINADGVWLIVRLAEIVRVP